MNFMPFFVTLFGAALGGVGWLIQVPWLLWIGVIVCILNLALNLASGVMKLPILPALFMLVGAVVATPWWYGVAVGLIVYTGLEALGEVYARLQASRARRDA